MEFLKTISVRKNKLIYDNNFKVKIKLMILIIIIKSLKSS